MPIYRRKNCIHTASGIFDLCKRLHIKPVVQYTVQMFTESEDTRCYVNTICPPEDGHVNARNILLMNKENCALKLVDEINLH